MKVCIGLCLLISGWLDGHGYSPAHRDAVLRYINRGSSFQPCAETVLGAYLGDWAGARRRWVHEHYPGCPPWQWQLAHMDWELRHMGNCAPFWTAKPGTEYQQLLQHFGKGR
jgi:hypothetical protein